MIAPTSSKSSLGPAAASDRLSPLLPVKPIVQLFRGVQVTPLPRLIVVASSAVSAKMFGTTFRDLMTSFVAPVKKSPRDRVVAALKTELIACESLPDFAGWRPCECSPAVQTASVNNMQFSFTLFEGTVNIGSRVENRKVFGWPWSKQSD